MPDVRSASRAAPPAPSGVSSAFLLEQLLNGVQLGVMLFLMAAGLTLVFGVMGLINLAHGSLYMVGAFACAWTVEQTGSFWLGLGAGLIAAALAGAAIEALVIRRLYDRDHLDQVLATFSLILIFAEAHALDFWRAAALSRHPGGALGRHAAAGRRPVSGLSAR